KKLEEEKKKEAARLAKEKKEREEKIDAFVRNIVKAGSDAAETTVISASSLPKVPEREAKIELELTEEEEAAPVSTNLTAKVETPSEKKEAAEPPKEKEPRIHVVGQGDNLGNISRKYYGEFKRWKDIAEANKEILPDPNKLKIGMKLVIPE
ncbi:LysM peptidoglycan-binding domain-containing protein, partial [bacterium]|nr:LysM peptidoglycan-binding domain-containing protein [bacterium]